jgi:hypothetical protein
MKVSAQFAVCWHRVISDVAEALVSVKQVVDEAVVGEPLGLENAGVHGKPRDVDKPVREPFVARHGDVRRVIKHPFDDRSNVPRVCEVLRLLKRLGYDLAGEVRASDAIVPDVDFMGFWHGQWVERA